MAIYSGLKSLDAEITIDFSDSTISMDYTNNPSNSFDSNHAATLLSDWENSSFSRKLPFVIVSVATIFFRAIIFPFYMFLSTTLQGKGLLKSQKFMYFDQKLRCFVAEYTYSRGKYERIIKIEKETETLWLTSNLYFEYEISESARDHILQIKIVRHYDHFYRYSKFHEIRQNGWDLIFTFNAIPENGYISVKTIE